MLRCSCAGALLARAPPLRACAVLLAGAARRAIDRSLTRARASAEANARRRHTELRAGKSGRHSAATTACVADDDGDASRQVSRKVSVKAQPERSLRRSMTSAGRSSIIEAYRKRLQQEAELRRPKGQ